MDENGFIFSPGSVRARTYVCVPVDESMANRSSVLESLMECNGRANLLEGVEVSDYLTWAEMKPKEAPNVSTEQLMHALKVILLL